MNPVNEMPQLRKARRTRKKQDDAMPDKDKILEVFQQEHQAKQLVGSDQFQVDHVQLWARYQQDMSIATQHIEYLQTELQKLQQVYAGKGSQEAAFVSVMAENQALHQKIVEDNQRYQHDMFMASQHVDHLQGELQKHQQAHAGGGSHEALLASLMAQNQALHQKIVEDNQRYQHDMSIASQHVDYLQNELQKQQQAHAEDRSHEAALASLTAQHNDLQQKMAEENKKYQHDMFIASQRVDHLQDELKKQTSAHEDRASKDQAAISALTAEVEALKQKVAESQGDIKTAFAMVDTLRQNLVTEQRLFSEKVSQDKDTIKSLKAEKESLEMKMAEDEDKHQEEIQRARKRIENLRSDLVDQMRLNSDKVSKEQSIVMRLKVEKKALQSHIAEENSRRQMENKKTEKIMETLMCEIQRQKQLMADQVSQNDSVVTSFKAEQEEHQQKMAEEMAILKQSAVQREQELLEEVEKIRAESKAKKESEESMEHFRALLLEERERANILEEEVERFKSAHQKLFQKYKSEVLTIKKET